MNRPPLEVADLIRVAGQRFIEAGRRWITGQHLKVLAAIERCRTAALGGHRDRCARCGYRAHSFNSCRNRHCPNPNNSRFLKTRKASYGTNTLSRRCLNDQRRLALG